MLNFLQNAPGRDVAWPSPSVQHDQLVPNYSQQRIGSYTYINIEFNKGNTSVPTIEYLNVYIFEYKFFDDFHLHVFLLDVFYLFSA